MRHVGSQLSRLIASRRAQDDDDLFARVYGLAELADRHAAARFADEIEGRVAAMTGAWGGRITAVPSHVGVEKVAPRVEAAADDGLVATAGDLDVAL